MRGFKRITAGGLDVAYLEDGPPDGPLVLCLHGFPDHAPSYRPLLASLAAAGFRAVAPWMRGYAPTQVPPDGRYQTAALGTDAIALADALAPGGVVSLVGHDWGASAVYAAAGARPDRFERIVVMSVPPIAAMPGFLADPEQLARSWYIWFFQSPLAEAAVPMNDFAFIDKLWRDWSPGHVPDVADMRALKDTLGSPGSLEAAIGYYRAMFDVTRHDPALAEAQAAANGPFAVPAMYLHGADDGCLAVSLVDPDALRASFTSGVRVETVEGAGHFLHVERPDVVNPLIVEFIAG